MREDYPIISPDGRDFVARGRRWRMANPALDIAVRDALVVPLMTPRHSLRWDAPLEARAAARAEVDAVKRHLGERGDVWWTDGAPDMNRRVVENTPYRGWFDELQT